MASTLEFEPGTHWWEASALTTGPPLLPRCLFTSTAPMFSAKLFCFLVKLPFFFNSQQNAAFPHTYHELMS